MRSLSCAVVVLGSLLLGAAPGAAQPTPPWWDWARVRNVPAGDEVVVTAATAALREYRMAFADETQLVLVRPLHRLSPGVLDAMRRIGPNWPAVLGGRAAVTGDVRIQRGSIQEAGIRVAALDVFPRNAVIEVRRHPTLQAGALLLDIAGAGAFFATTSPSNAYSMEARRRVGLPTNPVPPTTFDIPAERPVNPQDIIYRAAAGGAIPLDEVSWQRQLRGLPPSLRGKGHGR